MSDADRERYLHQARREGMTFSAWIRAAAEERLVKQQSVKRFESEKDLREFFLQCGERAGPGREPDWEETKRIINELPAWARDI
jgi:hypothetical protein